VGLRAQPLRKGREAPARSQRSWPSPATALVSTSLAELAHIAGQLHVRRKASRPMTAVMKVAPFAFCLALTLQACSSREVTTGSIAPVAGTWEAEAARLIRTLDLPAHLQESARDYAAKQMARGTAPKIALEQWIVATRDRGAMIRCRREVSATDECIARGTG
jgi:hypothetical protein